ncbi:Copine-8 [Orchesella cincta]|uniref:Copine-8 n=1 Tax=Orchesella cincta TaxID=48709 RepID=A0A1D2NJX1_ORCCI|nr:Copine-8 [Orchesella cincta]
MNDEFTPGTFVEPTSTVEISISCRNLLDMDVFSRSDPMCVVYHHPAGMSHWVELVRTEVIWDNLDPDFVTKVAIDYRFEIEQPLRFEVYDIDAPSANLENHDFLGYAECTLAQVVAAGYQGLSLPLLQNKSKYYPILPKNAKISKGSIILLAEELVQFKEEVTLKVQGYSMGRTKVYSCILAPKIFFVLSKINENGSYTVVYRSEASPGKTPVWRPATIPMRTLCNGDKDRTLQFHVFQVGLNGYHSSLGMVFTTVNKMSELVGSETVNLTGKNGLEKAATLKFAQVTIAPVFTFMEYISGGTQIHCCFAIDFTATSGSRPNPYEQAIQAVGEIIQDYDQTKKFPAYGFGARVPPSGEVRHNFPVTLTDNPFCNGIEGVMEAYRNCIRQIQLYGPTNFAPVIRDVANLARKNMEGNHYYVLVIITDGIITDMPQTKEVIVGAAHLPLSIIIVGVGRANFAAMDELDGDTVRLSYNGKFAPRDIVQFVPYRDSYTWMASVSPDAVQWYSGYESTGKVAKIRLAQEVLAEIPEQITSFMKSRSIVPVGRKTDQPTRARVTSGQGTSSS